MRLEMAFFTRSRKARSAEPSLVYLSGKTLPANNLLLIAVSFTCNSDPAACQRHVLSWGVGAVDVVGCLHSALALRRWPTIGDCGIIKALGRQASRQKPRRGFGLPVAWLLAFPFGAAVSWTVGKLIMMHQET